MAGSQEGELAANVHTTLATTLSLSSPPLSVDHDGITSHSTGDINQQGNYGDAILVMDLANNNHNLGDGENQGGRVVENQLGGDRENQGGRDGENQLRVDGENQGGRDVENQLGGDGENQGGRDVENQLREDRENQGGRDVENQLRGDGENQGGRDVENQLGGDGENQGGRDVGDGEQKSLSKTSFIILGCSVEAVTVVSLDTSREHLLFKRVALSFLIISAVILFIGILKGWKKVQIGAMVVSAFGILLQVVPFFLR